MIIDVLNMESIIYISYNQHNELMIQTSPPEFNGSDGDVLINILSVSRLPDMHGINK